MNHILIIEDDLEIPKLLAGFLSENGYRTTSLYDGTKNTLIRSGGSVIAYIEPEADAFGFNFSLQISFSI